MPALDTDQMELELAHDPRDWGHVKLLLQEVEEEMCERETALLRRISIWLMAVRVLKKRVRVSMVIKSPTRRDYEYHRSSLAYLKGVGRLLEGELRSNDDVDPAPVGLTFDDLRAIVNELEIQEREWYGDMKPTMKTQILEDVFGKE